MIQDAPINDPPRILELFNNYFQSVFTAAEELASQSAQSVGTNELVLIQEAVIAMLLKLDTIKHSGPDGIANSFLRRGSEKLSPVLTDIFNLSLATREIPDYWRQARAVPV